MTRTVPYDEQSRKDYLKGAFESNPLFKDRLDSARKHLEAAVERSPCYGRAHGELAYTYVNIAISGWHSEAEVEDAWKKAKIHAERAVELEPGDYMSYWNLAHYYINTGDDAEFATGLEMFETALHLFNTNTDPMDRKYGLLVEYGETLVYGGDLERGLELLEKAVTVPDWYFWTLAFGRYCAKDYAGAVAALDSMRSQPGDEKFLVVSLMVRGAAEAQRGNRAAAKEAVRQYLELSPNPEVAQHLLQQEFKDNAFRCYGDASKQNSVVLDLAQHWIEGLEKAGFPDLLTKGI